MTVLRIGEIEVVPLSDGTLRMPQQFYVGLDFGAHPELLAPDGRMHIPIGCYLLRTGGQTVLVDAGLGPLDTPWGAGGALPGALAGAGVSPADIDRVVCSHLHLDHVGWLVQDGQPYFPNAAVHFGQADWAQWVDGAAEDDATRIAFRTLADLGRLEPLDGDDLPIAPGLTARHTPGHTLGHYGFVISSGTERAVLLGDAVECPLQVAEPDFSVMSDVDPALAARTREALWRELEGGETLVGAAHFPGLEFGRILRGQGRRWFS